MASLPPPPPPGWQGVSTSAPLHPPPPGYRPPADPQQAKFDQRRKEWLRIQKSRFGEKRKNGFVDTHQEAWYSRQQLRRVGESVNVEVDCHVCACVGSCGSPLSLFPNIALPTTPTRSFLGPFPSHPPKTSNLHTQHSRIPESRLSGEMLLTPGSLMPQSPHLTGVPRFLMWR